MIFGLFLFFAVLITCLGIPFAAVFGIPWLLSDFVPRRTWRNAKTPGAMIAYGMLHPATRDDWQRAPTNGGLENGRFVNAKLGMTVVHGWMDCVDVGFPISAKERRLLLYAAQEFCRRETERKKREALENVVEKFEHAYGDGQRSNVIEFAKGRGQ
jgi:hypothetical protein